MLLFLLSLGMNYNHTKPLPSFQKLIDKLIINGYKPIAASCINNKDAFVFETYEESKKAFDQFEDKEKGTAWWYSHYNFIIAVSNYEKNSKYKVLVYWL